MTAAQKTNVLVHRSIVSNDKDRAMQQQRYTNFARRTRLELNLTNQAAVQALFAETSSTQVYLAAAKVSSIEVQNTYPTEGIYQNLMVQATAIDATFKNGVQKFLFLGFGCIYPKLALQLMPDGALLTGLREPANETSAVSKLSI